MAPPPKRVKVAVKSIDPGAARRLLTTSTTSAVALLAALKALLGDCTTWEPESVWLELAQRGIDPPEACRSKIQAGITLLFVPSFYWDGVVFEKTALSFDGGYINPDALEEASTAQLAWAVREASWILSQHDREACEFEHEPAAYAGIVAHREGLVEMPSLLSFGQQELNRQNASGSLQKEVKEAWATLKKSPTMETMEFKETPLDVQLARLVAVELHVREREKRAASELALLS